MNRSIFLMLFLSFDLCAAELTLLDAGLAEYNGQVVTLTEGVKVEHDLGVMEAEKMFMLPWTCDEKLDYPLMQLRGKVVIQLKNGGQLSCEKGDIDCRRLKGTFYVEEGQEPVVYREVRDGNTLCMKCRQMKIAFNEGSDLNPDRVKEIQAQEQVVIQYNDTFAAEGDEAFYEREKETITLISKDLNKQIHFNDKHGDIYADRAIVYCQLSDKKLVPAKIFLDGNVAIINRISDRRESLQYAVSDQAEYYPDTHILKLISHPKGRVLLYDKINDLQVSAPQIDIHRNKKTNKDSVKGIGDVRFSFKEGELEQLKRRLPMEGANNGSRDSVRG